MRQGSSRRVFRLNDKGLKTFIENQTTKSTYNFNHRFSKEVSSIKQIRSPIKNLRRLDYPETNPLKNHLNNTLDITLLVISILLVITLIVVVSWFCYQKRKDQNKIQELKVTANTQNYPEITIIRSNMKGSEDSTDTKGDSFSVVSSIWDTG